MDKCHVLEYVGPILLYESGWPGIASQSNTSYASQEFFKSVQVAGTMMENGVIKDNWKCMSDVSEHQSGAENSPMELTLWIAPGSSLVQVCSK